MIYSTKSITYNKLFATICTVSLVLSLSACDWMADKPITIATHVWVGYEQMFLARSEGWLDEKQVQLLETNGATESLQALAEGKADGAALTLDEMLKARAAGLPLTAVMVFDISAGADMLLVRPGIKRLLDLKGRRIGFEQGLVGELLLGEVLQTAGLSKQDVTLIPINADQHRKAWERKQLDAIITYEPVASKLQLQDAVKLFDSRQIPDTIIDVLAIRNAVLDASHASAIRHLISAHFRALHHLHTNPQDAAYRTASHLGLPAAHVLAAYKGLVLPDISNNFRMLAGTSPALLDSADRLSATMVRAGLLKQQDTLSSLINANYLPTQSPTN